MDECGKAEKGDATMSETRKRYGQQEAHSLAASRVCRRDIGGIHPRGRVQMRRWAAEPVRIGCSGHSPGPWPIPPDTWRKALQALQCDTHEGKRTTKYRRQRRIHLRFADVCHSLKEDQAGPGFKGNRPAFNIKEATHGQTPRKRPGAISERPQAGASGRIRTDQT